MNKKTLILGGVLIALIIAAYVYQGPLKQWQSSLGKPKNFLAAIQADKIDKMEIVKNGKTTTLEKQNDKWKVGGSKGFFVAALLADRLVQTVDAASQAELELVSNNKERKSEFGTDGSNVIVKFFSAGEKLAEAAVGKTGSDYVSSYVSAPDSALTYSVKADLANLFAQDDWRDAAIFAADASKINRIRFQYPDREFTIAKTGDNWGGVLPKKFAVNKDKAQKIVDLMANLTASSIPEQTFKGTGLDKYLIIIQATGEGMDNVLMVGNANKNNEYFAKRGDSDNIYLISKAERDELNKTMAQLK